MMGCWKGKDKYFGHMFRLRFTDSNVSRFFSVAQVSPARTARRTLTTVRVISARTGVRASMRSTVTGASARPTIRGSGAKSTWTSVHYGKSIFLFYSCQYKTKYYRALLMPRHTATTAATAVHLVVTQYD